MALQNFDQLNSMATKWFSKVEVSEEEKKKRVDLALDYCEIMIMLFLLITEQEFEREECVAFLGERLKVLAEREIGTDDVAYINDWSKVKAEEIVDKTYEEFENEIEDASEENKKESKKEKPKEEKHVKVPELDIDVPEDEYWTSEERGLLIGIELSTTVYNFNELQSAIKEGKTRKVWMTEADDRVRPTHDAVHGTDIPINELFLVGNSYMLMPGDTVHGAEMKEIAGCRCHLMCY